MSGTIPEKPGKNAWRRCVVFLAGSLFLALPAWVILQTVADARVALSGRGASAAIDRCRTALELFRSQDFIKLQLEQNLEDFARVVGETTKRVPAREFGSALGEAARQALERHRVRRLPIRFLQMVAVTSEGISLASGGREVVEAFRWGAPLPGRPDFSTRFLGAGCRYFADEFNSADDAIVERELPIALGISKNLATVLGEFRARCFHTTIGGESVWAYWQPLLRPDWQEILRQTPSQKAYFPGEAFFSPEFRQRILLGAVLAVVAGESEGPKNAAEVVSAFEESGMGLAVLKENRPPVLSSGFPRELLEKFGPFEKNTQTSSDWVAQRGLAMLDGPCEVIAALRIPPLPPAVQSGFRWMEGSAVGGFLLGAVLLGAVVFLEAGFTARLGWQLLGGFLLAVLLPLAITFACVEPLADGIYDEKAAQERRDLRRRIDQAEMASLLNRPWVSARISRSIRQVPFLAALDQGAAAWQATSGNLPELAVKSLHQALAKVFHKLYSWPVDISIQRIQVVGPFGLLLEFPPSGGDTVLAHGILAQVISRISETLLLERNPGFQRILDDRIPGGSDREWSSGEAKAEMVTDVGRTVIQAILGPEAFFEFLSSLGEPFKAGAGYGNVFIQQILLPSRRNPRFHVYVFSNSGFFESHALERVLAPGPATFPVLFFHRDHLGDLPRPSGGEAYPFLRRVARQVDYANIPLSLTMEGRVPLNHLPGRALEAGGAPDTKPTDTRMGPPRQDRAIPADTYLVEARPSRESRQFVLIGLVPESFLKEWIQNLKDKIHSLALLALIGSLILAWSASRDILRPIEELGAGIAEVRQERFGFRIASDRTDEMGEVCRAFDLMARGLAERQVFGRMVSSAALLAMEGKEHAVEGKTGSHQETTVLFLGILGFAEVMRTHPPEEALRRLNVQISRMTEVMLEFGGDIDKLLGEKILATFSSEARDDPRPVRNASAAILALLRLRSEGELPFDIAAGLHVGPVMIGFLGTGKRRDYTVIGDTVNLAARAESLAESLTGTRAILTEAAFHHAEGFSRTRLIGSATVKGKQQPVCLYQLEET